MQQHLDILQYIGIVFGGIYSLYRRIVKDRNSDKMDKKQSLYITQLITQLAEMQDQNSHTEKSLVELRDKMQELHDHSHTILEDDEKIKSIIVDLTGKIEAFDQKSKKE